MVKYVKRGDIHRTLSCKHCDKIFTGDKKNVDKQFEIHNKYVHGIVNEQYPILKLGMNVINQSYIMNTDEKKYLELFTQFGI